MVRPLLTHDPSFSILSTQRVTLRNCALACAALLATGLAAAQVVTINTKTGNVSNGSNGEAGSVDRRFAQIKPTDVPLAKTSLDPKTRQEVMRIMQSEQGFAMRPFPRGHKGLTLVANGKLEPAGEGYLNMVTNEGTSAKPGDRVVLTDVKIEHSKIVFEINGGPDHKHRFLRHVQLGTGPMMNPAVQSDDPDPVGSRLTLAFKGDVPELTGSDVKALLAPLISFDVKTPIQAFTDTLPGKLKDAIMNHHVLVGMSTDMVIFAKGQPETKSREMEGQMPFEEWIYGKPPRDVEFVRINGNRVIRVEVAKMGEAPVVFTKDEVEGLMRTDGTPLEAKKDNTRTIAEGDVERDPNTQAPLAPPSLRKPGETLPAEDPADKDKPSARVGIMRPVQFPKPKADDSADQNGQAPDPKDGQTPAASTGKPAAAPADSAPAAGSQPADAQPPPVKPQMLLQTRRH